MFKNKIDIRYCCCYPQDWARGW